MSNTKVKLEYIYLDGYTSLIKAGEERQAPNANVRSKTKIVNKTKLEFKGNGLPEIGSIPKWNSDGSSTKQAEGDSSDIVLKPVSVYKDPTRGENSFLIMCEVYTADGGVHKSNTRRNLERLYKYHQDHEARFGFEQEYVIWDVNKRNLVGWPESGNPDPQGRYYCGVGSWNVGGRDIVEEHMDACIDAGLDITGVNAEVMLGQWEYQIGGPDTNGLEVCDQLWVSRWLLHRISEKYGYVVDFEPKPKVGDWNGSGMHVNFSTKDMRQEEGIKAIYDACEKLREVHQEHIYSYGTSNDRRLTGDHETASISDFTFGVSDRGASIRIPQLVYKKNKGYLEDRRPSSNGDPYMIGAKMLETVCGKVEEEELAF